MNFEDHITQEMIELRKANDHSDMVKIILDDLIRLNDGWVSVTSIPIPGFQKNFNGAMVFITVFEASCNDKVIAIYTNDYVNVPRPVDEFGLNDEDMEEIKASLVLITDIFFRANEISYMLNEYIKNHP